MLKSIKLKLMLYFSVLITLILLGMSYLLYQDTYSNQISHLDGSLYVITNNLIQEMKEEKDKIDEVHEEIEEVQQVFGLDALYVRILNYDLDTNRQSTIAESSNINNSIFAQFDFEQKHKDNIIIYKTYNGYRTAMQLKKIDSNNLQLIQTAVVIVVKKSIITTLIFADIIIFLFFILGSYLIISKTLLPVNKVVENVNKIEAYDYTKRVNTKNIPNEIKELVDTFNRLLARHQKSYNKISQFSSDASHELKTPLTCMRGEIEVGLRRKRSSNEYQKIMQKSLSKIIEIQELIDGLLFLAKSDKLKIQSSFEEVYIDEIITECHEELKEMANAKSIDIKINLIPLTIKGDSKLLKIACTNILKNAILYSPQKTEIRVTIKKDDSRFMVLFQDQGVGIPKEKIEHIFDRFYRVVKTSGGTGLGLSIVKMILDIHDFDILIKSKTNKGVLLEISGSI